MAEFEIQVPIKLQISDETADLCAKVLEMYIQEGDKVVATLMQPGPEGIKKYVRILNESKGEYEEAGENELQAQPDNKETEEIEWQLSKLEQ